MSGRVGRYAVLAHHDPEHQLDPYLRRLIEQLATACQRVYVVTTSGIETCLLSLPPEVEVVTRADRGHYFASYKYGIGLITNLAQVREIILVNDSFYTTRKFDLQRILRRMDESADIWGLCESWQFARHVQSWFIVLRTKAIRSDWLSQYMSRIYQVQDKQERIFRHEIGLTQSALDAGLVVKGLYPMFGAALQVLSRWLRLSWERGNPSYQMPMCLARTWGVVKVDVLKLGVWQGSPGRLLRANRGVSPELAHLRRLCAHHRNDVSTDGSCAAKMPVLPDVCLDTTERARVALILHLYYVDLIDEFVDAICRLPMPCDIFISICDYVHLDRIVDAFRPISNRLLVYVVENRGRDVRPFLMIAKSGLLDGYECAVKLHSKKSAYSERGEMWRRELLEGLLGSAESSEKTLTMFESDVSLGVVAPRNQYVSSPDYWGHNRKAMMAVAARQGRPAIAEELFFVAGTMFWFRPAAIASLWRAVDLQEFEAEQGQADGTLAHAVERLICTTALAQGYRCAPAEDLKVALRAPDVAENRVLVLS